MSSPTREALAALDMYIKTLGEIGEGLTLDDFRTEHIKLALKTERQVRIIVYGTGIVLMIALVLELVLFRTLFSQCHLAWGGIWSISLGGLGAIASISLQILKILPKESLRLSDKDEVILRIFLACVFSLVLSLTLIPDNLEKFYNFIDGNKLVGGKTVDKPAGGLLLLLPFLCGYSIPLVLGLLDKAITAIRLTFGLDDGHPNPRSGGPRPPK